MAVAEVVAHHRGVFALHQRVVVGCVVGVLVNSLSADCAAHLATCRLMYSEPLSAWKPLITKGNTAQAAARSAAETLVDSTRPRLVLGDRIASLIW